MQNVAIICMYAVGAIIAKDALHVGEMYLYRTCKCPKCRTLIDAAAESGRFWWFAALPYQWYLTRVNPEGLKHAESELK